MQTKVAQIKTTTIDVNLRLLGAFNTYFDREVLSVNIPPGITIETLRSLLLDYLLDKEHLDNGLDIQSLIANSRFSDQSDLLADEFIITSTCKLNVVPPLN